MDHAYVVDKLTRAIGLLDGEIETGDQPPERLYWILEMLFDAKREVERYSIQSNNALRCKRYRERRGAAPCHDTGHDTCHDTVASARDTVATMSPTCKRHDLASPMVSPPLSSPLDSPSDSPPSLTPISNPLLCPPSEDSPPKRAKIKKEIRPPVAIEEWRPSDKHRELAYAEGRDDRWVEREADRYRDQQVNAKVRHRDREAGFRNWIRNAPGFEGNANGHAKRPSAVDTLYRAAFEAAEIARRQRETAGD